MLALADALLRAERRCGLCSQLCADTVIQCTDCVTQPQCGFFSVDSKKVQSESPLGGSIRPASTFMEEGAGNTSFVKVVALLLRLKYIGSQLLLHVSEKARKVTHDRPPPYPSQSSLASTSERLHGTMRKSHDNLSSCCSSRNPTLVKGQSRLANVPF